MRNWIWSIISIRELLICSNWSPLLNNKISRPTWRILCRAPLIKLTRLFRTLHRRKKSKKRHSKPLYWVLSLVSWSTKRTHSFLYCRMRWRIRLSSSSLCRLRRSHSCFLWLRIREGLLLKMIRNQRTNTFPKPPTSTTPQSNPTKSTDNSQISLAT